MNAQIEFRKSLKLLNQHVGSVDLHIDLGRNATGAYRQYCLMVVVDRLKYAKNCLHHAELLLAEMKKTGGLK